MLRYPVRRVDVLINNAGIFIPSLSRVHDGRLQRIVSTTLAGFLYVSQLVVKQMLKQKDGSIVNVSTSLVDQPSQAYRDGSSDGQGKLTRRDAVTCH